MDPTELVARIGRADQISPQRLAELTSRFVSVPSVNGEHPERDLALVIAEELRESGYVTTLVGERERPSLAVSGGGEPAVLLNGHLDTVPVDDPELWRFPPFEGVIAGGAVHGRGACDMKGGLAIQVAVAQWLASTADPSGLVLHFAMGEERGEAGTESLIEAGYTAPLGVVLEPTDLQVGVAQRGLVTLRLTVPGRAGHASRPDLTINPLDRLPELLALVARLNASPGREHHLLGPPAWTATMVHAGVIPSMVPGSCDLYVDRRMIPGESVESVVATMGRALHEVLPATGITIELVEEEGIYAPAEIDPQGRAVRLIGRSLGLFGMGARLFGTPYASDVRHLIHSGGVEAVTFGPGRFANMHARDESISIDDMSRAARVVAGFVALALLPEESAGRD